MQIQKGPINLVYSFCFPTNSFCVAAVSVLTVILYFQMRQLIYKFYCFTVHILY